MTYKKKLIEVALPLDAINKEAAREKNIRHGHPSTLHLWWARRPLVACRAVLWASIVDDPSSRPDEFPTESAQVRERERLFHILEQLVKWENSGNQDVLREARAEIVRSSGGNPPSVLDPFCGGGSIPLEAQRLGLEALASDLNPVAVLITKALIEIPPKFAHQPPVNPEHRTRGMGARWSGAAGLAADVSHYGKWMRGEAEKRIGHLYPKVTLPPEYGGSEATVIAWLWARTVACPNPACGATMPLVNSFWLSTKPDKKVWLEPVIDRHSKSARFEIKSGRGVPPPGTVGNRQGATCIFCQTPVPYAYIRGEGKADRLGVQLIAMVAEGRRGRLYLPASAEHEEIALRARPWWTPESPLPEKHRSISAQLWGLDQHGKLFTARQLTTLTTFAELVDEAHQQVLQDALSSGLPAEGTEPPHEGIGAQAYADAVATYLGLAASKLADYNSSLALWSQPRDQAKATFARQAVPMVWDFAEVNPLAGAAGDFKVTLNGTVRTLSEIVSDVPAGYSAQRTATAINDRQVMISTDPPYYDNVGYADLSDFFYVWLRKSLARIYPSLFGTLITPKSGELIADRYRHKGGKREAQLFFERGLGTVFERIQEAVDPSYPVTIFYAFKQSESEQADDGDAGSVVSSSTGWETMLEGLISARFQITGTWPMRTERSARAVGIGTNALASSVVLVCRQRPEGAQLATRREFLGALKAELPGALRRLQHGSVAPVDLAQAAIGPGMAVYSRYPQVLEPDGTRLSVRTALQIINQALDEVLTEQESEYDSATRWAIAWFEQFAMDEGPFGQANVLAQAKNTAVNALVEAGVVHAQGGRVRLLMRDELSQKWDPQSDGQITVWELSQHLIRALNTEGEEAAARLLALSGSLGETARDLAYRLYTTCERKKWAQEALDYNALVVAWPELSRLAAQVATTRHAQPRML